MLFRSQNRILTRSEESKNEFPHPSSPVHPRAHGCTSVRTSLYIRAHISVHPRCTNSCCYLNLNLSCILVYKFGYLPPPPPTLTNICKLQVFLNLAARLRSPSPLPRRTGGLSLGALGYGGFIARRRYRVVLRTLTPTLTRHTKVQSI